VDEHVAEHTELLRTIAAGQADKAEELAREHVIGFDRTIRAAI
jgi:DNA-binding FadR family transcriptional regulator